MCSVTILSLNLCSFLDIINKSSRRTVRVAERLEEMDKGVGGRKMIMKELTGDRWA